MKRICVFAGSNSGKKPVYAEAARELGHALATHNLGLVYGGSNVGLMGIVANAALEKGGEVIGVIPTGVIRSELAHRQLTILHEVGSMHERKALMAELADGFIALPGGLGTFDELFEIATWAQLGLHTKPIGLLNIAGYYNILISLLKQVSSEGFMPTQNLDLFLDAQKPDLLLERFIEFTPAALAQKWDSLPPES